MAIIAGIAIATQLAHMGRSHSLSPRGIGHVIIVGDTESSAQIFGAKEGENDDVGIDYTFQLANHSFSVLCRGKKGK